VKEDYEPEHTAAFFDTLGEKEWLRFEDGRTPPQSLEVHLAAIRRYVQPGDRVLDVGAGPGRFTIELARLGAEVTVADISPRQLELNAEKVAAAGLEERVRVRVLADVTDLSRFADASFDAAVCFGGPLSYLVDRAEEGLAELLRVTRPGGHVLLSVMSLVGAVLHFAPQLLDLVRRDGAERNEAILRTGLLPQGEGYGHLPMKLYRSDELTALLSRHGEVVFVSAAGLFPALYPPEPELQEFIVQVERQLAPEPGAVSCGQHILAVLRTP
jgi:SAM-dependent methyltransferase